MVQVLNNKDILPLIIVHGARNEILAHVHRMLMAEAVNTTMGGIAQELHDEVLEYILQAPGPWHTPFCAHLCSLVNRLVCTYFSKLVYINRY